jgi:hypothetical protein
MKKSHNPRRFLRWRDASTHSHGPYAHDPSQSRRGSLFIVATLAADGSGDRRVSLLDELVESDFVKISRSPDFDNFRSIGGLGEATSIPLDCKDFAASFASLRLKACTIYLQRTFPRISSDAIFHDRGHCRSDDGTRRRR